MSWKESLRPASFRGVEFKVETADTGFGRRNSLHEYPLRDVPYTEDLGKKAREINIRAYVIGDDYITRRDALMSAIENRSEPGTLIHPTLGSMVVVPAPGCRVTFDNQQGGIEYFDLVFMEAGENRFPDQSIDTSGAVNQSALSAYQAIKNVFSGVFNVNNLPEFLQQSAEAISNDLVQAIKNSSGFHSSMEAPASTLLESLEDFSLNISDLVQSPSDFSEAVQALIAQLLGLYSEPQDSYLAFKKLMTFGDNYPEVEPNTTTKRQLRNNQDAIIRLTRRAGVIGMAQSAAAIDFTSYDDAVVTRDEIADFLDDEILALADSDVDQDEAYNELETIRAESVRDITARAANLERIKELQLQTSTPSLVLSYSLYDSASRADEIVTRNKVRHPGFIPAVEPIQVLV